MHCLVDNVLQFKGLNQSVFQTMLRSMMPPSLYFIITSATLVNTALPSIEASLLWPAGANLFMFTFRTWQRSAVGNGLLQSPH